ncbi:DUF2922 domain-containing protein [Enterococcus sp. 669A]|uniref:DUF2922 domain-containing protein n=1 Tax=Candidatus Enterococcus moelleringii TaxID=2815325 RepID=A0ABS3LBX9_9ENTE|nr:DUF2922 domain-containing protein [Enterococcus sp. 669A]MBO1307137.1 DUF2922 domain-containing protein [Enterococcus sp. 669A]
MLKLATVFENAAGKNHRWSYNDPNPNKTPEQIKAALETLTTLNLFQKDGVRQFCKVVSAKFVETIETPIFDLSNQAETYVADPNNAFAPFIIADEVTQVSEPAKEVEEIKAVVKEVSREQAIVKPAEVAVEAKSALETIEAAPKSVLEKAGIPSQAKAAFINPVTAPSAKDPVVTSDVIEKAISKSASAEQLEDAETGLEAPVAESPAVKKSTNPRKEKVDRLRAYHEANKKKTKKGKKKKR